MIEQLFTPFTVKSLTVKNRFVMSPMTRYFSPDGIPTADVAAYYARRAANDVGLIVTEGVAIRRPASVESPNVPLFYGEKALAGWQRVVDEVHRAGAKFAPQLWHVGAWYEQSGWTPPGPFEGPSGLKEPGVRTGVTMSEQDIADVIAAYAEATSNARKLGCDTVNLHAAHGYLIDQFFWKETNERTDRWGGPTLRERARFGAEVIKAMRAAAGPDMPIMMRISQWKIQAYHHRMANTPQELAEWLEPLVDAGVDVFDCSQRRFWEPEFEGSDLNFAGWVKKLTGKPTMTVGSVGLSRDLMGGFEPGATVRPSSLEDLERRFERGEFDLVGVGRALLSDATWVRKVRENRREELMDFDPSHLATLS